MERLTNIINCYSKRLIIFVVRFSAAEFVRNEQIEFNDKVFEKGICHPFQKSNNKLANCFL